MPKFGAHFVQSSFDPLRKASKALEGGRLSEGLEALGRHRLQAGVDDGIDRAARSLKVKRERVREVLPVDDIADALDVVAGCQKTARASVGQFVASLGGLIQPAPEAELTTSQLLRAVAEKYALDQHISEPVSALSEAVARWEEVLRGAGEKLSADPSLHAILRRRQVTFAVVSSVVIVVLVGLASVAIWHHVVVAGAQDRIAALLVQTDPCAVESVNEDDLDHVLPGQMEKIVDMRSICARRRQREAYLASCSDLADHVDAGKLLDPDDVTAGSAHALLKRIAERSLTPSDLTIGHDVMPCKGTPSHLQYWKAYIRTVTTSPDLWGRVDKISPHVRSLLTAEGVSLSPRSKATLVFRVEAVTKRAITNGAESELIRARHLCELVDQLGYPQEPWCKALERIDGKKN